MSKDNHPNVHAVKLMLEVSKTTMDCLRGPAELRKKDLEFQILDKCRRFVIEISEFLDDEMTDGKTVREPAGKVEQGS